MMLALGAAATILNRDRKVAALCNHPIGVVLIALAGWSLLRTIPYINEFGEDAARDAALWGYSGFAVICGALTLRQSGILPEAVRRYARFVPWYIFLGPISAVVTASLGNRLPVWPGTDAGIPDLKSGDLCVHLAGAACFVLSGLPGARTWWLVPIFGGAIAAGGINRGGLLAFITAAALVLLLERRLKKTPLVLGALAIAASAFLIIDPHIQLPGRSREISSRQIAQNLISIGSDRTEADLSGTKQWRLDWWNRIVDYTIFGDYFWTGKGYGVNLATSDGIDIDTPLRSPHNSHLTFLARSGVPGFVLWATLQLTWAALILSSQLRAKRIGEHAWASLFAWILGYWAAFMVNASFDVSFEGPMSAVPFWMIFGLGWGAHIVFKRQTAALRRNSRGRTWHRPTWTLAAH
jgi:hypothetical protein